ncbi:MAG: hypothetical protein Q8Q62_15695, partial [Mesorhizobium sp.]|nr:hypothetical protein [Mesorhizobium sp.]
FAGRARRAGTQRDSGASHRSDLEEAAPGRGEGRCLFRRFARVNWIVEHDVLSREPFRHRIRAGTNDASSGSSRAEALMRINDRGIEWSAADRSPLLPGERQQILDHILLLILEEAEGRHRKVILRHEADVEAAIAAWSLCKRLEWRGHVRVGSLAGSLVA